MKPLCMVVRLLIAFACLLVSCVSVDAGIAFSWSGIVGDSQSLQTTTVPVGMLWRVSYVSGFSHASGSQFPFVVSVSHQAADSFGAQTLYLAPRLVSQDISFGTNQVVASLYAIDSPVTAYYRDNVVARRVPGSSNGATVYFSLTGTLTPLLTGDFNGDSEVNAADYTAFRDGLGPYWQPSDYADWVAAYGTSASSAIAIPEPSAFVLVSTAGLLTSRRLRTPRR